MKKSGHLHVRQGEPSLTRIHDDMDMDIPADLVTVRRHVVSLEYERITLAQTVQYARRNLEAESYSREDGQRMFSAAMLDLDELDRSLLRARRAQATLENPAAAQWVGYLQLFNL